MRDIAGFLDNCHETKDLPPEYDSTYNRGKINGINFVSLYYIRVCTNLLIELVMVKDHSLHSSDSIYVVMNVWTGQFQSGLEKNIAKWLI